MHLFCINIRGWFHDRKQKAGTEKSHKSSDIGQGLYFQKTKEYKRGTNVWSHRF